MKREELLAWIGVVLAVPPIIYLIWADGRWAAGAFVVLFLAGLFTVYVKGQSDKNRPTFTVTAVKKRIKILDKDAHVAEFEGTYLIKANHRATEFVVSHLGGDGTIENIQLNGSDPDAIRKAGPRTEIVKRFNPEFAPGDTFKLILTYLQKNSFPRNPDGIGHVVEFHTRRFEIEVVFHPERPCLHGKLTRRYAGSLRKGGEVERTSNGLRLSTEVKKPPLGSEYTLEWEW